MMRKKRASKGERTEDQIVTTIRAWVQDGSMAEVEDYVRRGRRYRDCDDETVRERWAQAFRGSWHLLLSPGGRNANEADLAAELALRDLDLPGDRVEQEMGMMRQLGELLYRSLEADPERWQAANDALLLQIAEFQVRAAKRH